MERSRLDSEGLWPLPERIETALANVNVNPTVNLNIAIPVVTQVNTGVQVAALASPIQTLVQGNLAGVGVGQSN